MHFGLVFARAGEKGADPKQVRATSLEIGQAAKRTILRPANLDVASPFGVDKIDEPLPHTAHAPNPAASCGPSISSRMRLKMTVPRCLLTPQAVDALITLPVSASASANAS